MPCYLQVILGEAHVSLLGSKRPMAAGAFGMTSTTSSQPPQRRRETAASVSLGSGPAGGQVSVLSVDQTHDFDSPETASSSHAQQHE